VIEAYVPIQNGCDKFCTFCAVPYTRGREVSRPSDDILEEIRGLVESGCRSITLLGQNVNSYGLDRKGAELTFTQLLKSIGEIGVLRGGGFWTYFTSPHPRDITRELLETMASYDVLAKWIHLPLQSGDDKVLLKMNRNHSMDRYRRVVQDIRSILPGTTLFTDIIVGFSGETREQFEKTAQAMVEFRYDMAYIARYSPRPGAASARWEDDVPAEEKERRYRELSEILLRVSGPVNMEKLGKVFRVLVTGENRQKGFFSGYTEGRIPVRIAGTDVPVGEFTDIEITSARPLSVEGRMVRSRIDQVS
jgi:tRNA-2-methylthio-N6-dimethylallyladenosine synthase